MNEKYFFLTPRTINCCYLHVLFIFKLQRNEISLPLLRLPQLPRKEALPGLGPLSSWRKKRDFNLNVKVLILQGHLVVTLSITSALWGWAWCTGTAKRACSSIPEQHKQNLMLLPFHWVYLWAFLLNDCYETPCVYLLWQACFTPWQNVPK